MLYSVAGGHLHALGRPQMVRFAVGLRLLVAAALVDIRVLDEPRLSGLWRVASSAHRGRRSWAMSALGAQRWIDARTAANCSRPS